MASASDRSYTRRDTVLFFVCVGLSVVALVAPTRVGLGVADALRETALAPLVWLQARAEEGRTSRVRFREVTAQRDSSAYLAQGLPSLLAENERLRQLLSLSRRLSSSYVAAEVLHQSTATDGRTLLLSAGSSQGVSPFDPVVSPEGLIGVVLSTAERTSIAMTWAHPEFRAGAFTEDGNVFGIVAPASAASPSETLLELRGVPYRDSILPGVRVVASGLGGVFPQGIPIGTVMGVLREEPGWERTYLLKPASHPMSISHVIILTAQADSALGNAFRRDSSLP